MVEFQPLLDMLESSENKQKELKEEKERLIKAYTAGVLNLDEIATQKADVDKRIDDLTQAIQQLRAEVKPKLLSKEKRKSIEEMAAQVREGADLTDNDPETQREIYRMIHMKVTLSEIDGKQWADVNCILGQKRVPAAYTANGCDYP
jgi:uncharacterized coiled-coil DUF342 family protein